MTDMLTGIVPLWVDLGYRFTPITYGGIYFQHGFGSLNTDSGKPESACTSSGVSCSTSDVRVGVELDVHFTPDHAFDPWVGFGTGLEIQTFQYETILEQGRPARFLWVVARKPRGS